MSVSVASLNKAETKGGWETDLAKPFDLVERMPRQLRRHPNGRSFIAEDSNARYRIGPWKSDQLMIVVTGDQSKEVHCFQTNPTLRASAAWSIITLTSRTLKYALDHGIDQVDISNFASAISALRHSVHLTDGDDLQLDPLQEAALTYALDKAGVDEEVYISTAGPIVIGSDEATYWSGGSLPRPLDTLEEAVYVCMHEGALVNLRAPFLEFWPWRELASNDPLETLISGGFTQEAIDALDSFAEQMRINGLWSQRG